MQPTFIVSATHKFTPPENWDQEKDGKCGSLFVRCDLIGPNKIIELCSCWKPTPEELALLNAGGAVEVGLCIPNQPAMRVGVVPEAVAPMGYDEHGPATP